MSRPAGETVCLAYVHSEEVAHSWHLSVVELIGWDLGADGRIVRGGWLAMQYGTDGLPAARNEAVARFLAEKSADWLFWVDTDMGFAPDTVDRLLAVADPVERPIVGALCFAQKEVATDGMGGYRCAARPTIFDWVVDGDKQGLQGRTSYPVNSVIRVAGTGSACILIHRSALERVTAEYGEEWYKRIYNTSMEQWVGEDLSFCMRAGALDIPIHVHTGVRASHLKNLWLAEGDYWDQVVPPPAAQECAVIVPVMRRPDNAAPFMQSLRASTGLAKVYAVAGRDDAETVAAWKAAGADVLLGDDEQVDDDGPVAVSFAERVNLGYRQTREPWLFLVGDDVRFYPGWLDHAQAIAGDGFHVIGTNDLSSPRTVAGEHSPHLLVRRSYVDEQGAGWDGPGVVAHEGYRHWFVDTEIVTAAKQRDVWAMALGSKVEHLHPIFGTAPDDEVYQLGQSHAKQDEALFRKRRAKQAAT